jgi:hypothetical protein
MDSDLDRRISGILARRERETAAVVGSENQPDRDRRAAHDRVIAELPRLAAKICGAVAELNDRIAEGAIRIKFDIADHTPSAEALYTFSVMGRDREGPVLTMSVDYTGKTRSIMRGDEARSLLEADDIFSIDRSHLMNLLVALLEAQYR